MKNKIFIGISLCITIIILILGGCGNAKDSNKITDDESKVTSTNEQNTVVITDSSGAQVKIPAKIN